VDARCAPGGILCHHAKDQIANFFRNPSSADPPAGFADSTPIECKPRSMPTDHGLGTDDHQGLFPFGPKPSRHYPEELIQGCEPWPGMPSLSLPGAAGEELGSQAVVCDGRGRDEGLRLRVTQRRRPSEGAIAFRLWTATLHVVEITGGQNFGESQPSRIGGLSPSSFVADYG
jgi:hypothetical protein